MIIFIKNIQFNLLLIRPHFSSLLNISWHLNKQLMVSLRQVQKPVKIYKIYFKQLLSAWCLHGVLLKLVWFSVFLEIRTKNNLIRVLSGFYPFCLPISLNTNFEMVEDTFSPVEMISVKSHSLYSVIKLCRFIVFWTISSIQSSDRSDLLKLHHIWLPVHSVEPEWEWLLLSILVLSLSAYLFWLSFTITR